MITCQFKGELGNNLFQVAALLEVAKKGRFLYNLPTNRDCYISVKDRPIELPEMFQYQFNCRPTAMQYAEYLAPDIDPKVRNFRYVEIPIQDNMCIVGYFQSEKYFQYIADEIRDVYFRPKQEVLEYIEKKYPHILNSECVSIHIRRGGDRPALQDAHKHVESEFYTSAVSLIIEKNPSIEKFVIFSDKMNDAKEMFPEDDNVIYVEGEKNYVDMFLMSMCKHNILANSSFSWWAAYLNRNKNKTVIAPKSEWFGPALKNLDLSDLFPSSWITL